MAGRIGLALGCAAAALLFVVASAAAAPSQFWQVPESGPVGGSGAGQIQLRPTGVAADTREDSGHVYVVDPENARIDEFTAFGEFVKAIGWNVDASNPAEEPQVCTAGTGCKAGTTGAGPGQIGPRLTNGLQAEGIAVDQQGNVYLADLSNHRIQKFGPDGSFLLMFGGEVDKTTGADVCTAESTDICGEGVPGTASGRFNYFPAGKASSAPSDLVAVGPTGTVYAADAYRIQAFGPDGHFESEFPLPEAGEVPGAPANGEAEPQGLAVDADGDVFFDFFDSRFGSVASKYPYIYQHSDVGWSLFAEPPPGSFVYALEDDEAGNLWAVVDPKETAGVGRLEGEQIFEFGPSGETLIPSAAEREANEAKKSFEREYFGQPPGVKPVIPGLAVSNGCGLQPADVIAAYSRDAPGSLIAYGPPPNPEICPPPARPPKIADQFAAEVGTNGAVVQAKINSRFWPTTTYWVEYGTRPCDGSGCARVPATPGLALKSLNNSPVTTQPIALPNLAPNTTYHFRFVAKTVYRIGDEVQGEAEVRGVGGEVGLDGAEGQFTTPSPGLPSTANCPNAAFRTGVAGFLPDCRAYEMVSPVDKEGGDIVALPNINEYRAGLFQSAESGARFTYSAYRAFAGARSAAYTEQYLASRQPGVGWATEPITPAFGEKFLEVGIATDTPFKAFSPDLCQGWLRLDFAAEPPLDSSEVPGYPNLFERQNCGATAGAYEALSTTPPPVRPPVSYSTLELQGTSADGGTAIFVANDKLTPEAPQINGPVGNSQAQLYVRDRDGLIRFVCMLPDGTPTPVSCAAGSSPRADGQARFNDVAGSISDDGSKVFFSTGGSLYVRINPTEPQSAVVGGLCTEPTKACTRLISENATFWAAAADGSRVIYTRGVNRDILAEYRSHADGSATLADSGVVGVLGAGEDAQRVYFSSTSNLAEGAIEGEPNLYFKELGGPVQYITTLAGADVTTEGASAKTITPNPNYRAARVTSDGLHAAFISSAPLTGYDNTDVVTGKADNEVFHYSAPVGGGKGTLVCVSCNPSGARPVGSENELFPKPLEDTPTAAWIPTWESDLYASRPLADDGSRLFFNSYDPLVPRDTNGLADVYEWREGGGRADCQAQGAERYVPASKGCLSLISSGRNNQNSEFVDADPSGRDVFFTTGAGLVPQDPGLIDVYDAREGGGLPSPAAEPGECEGQDCQRSTAPPPALAPATPGFHGPGNPPRGHCRKGKRQVRKHGRIRCVRKASHRQHHRRHEHHRRRRGKHSGTARQHGDTAKNGRGHR